MPNDEDYSLIERAFSDLEEQEERFLRCERAYRAVYKEDNRTSKRKSAERSRSKLYIPLVKTTVNIIHSVFKTSFMSDRCPIEVKRVGLRSDHDLILQNALTAVLKNYWKKKEHRVGLSKAVLSALYLPLGIVNLFYDKTAAQIRTKFIPITDLAFDRHASDINDIEYVAFRYNQSAREIREKLERKFYKSKDQNVIAQTTAGSERIAMRDLYVKSREQGRIVWKLKTYANGTLVREATFSRLPFHYGYCIETTPSINEDEREDEIAIYGSCIPEIVWELQEEYNIKRNQKIDITENQIDPTYAIDKDAGSVAISDITARKKFIRVLPGATRTIKDVITVMSEPGTYGLSEEIAMLKNEYEIATGVNSVMTGQTSPSDRRATSALQAVNSASGTRIESMLQTLLDTMLQSYAEHFVWLIYKFTSDEEFVRITEDPQIIEKIGDRSAPLDFDVNVNFGTTIANEVKIGQLNSLMQVLAQANMATPAISGEIIKEILTLILGENAPIEAIDEAMAQMQALQQAQLQAAQQAQSAAESESGEALDVPDRDEHPPSDDELDRAALLNGGI